ncbi:hypothetical protein [Bacillus dakarensis]|uniref:hypothetical protein n=1 Tax=Robertmurraya dakarensis TaxID=1926278 RepID=UPI0009823ECF|nr:hypothetical protein [Bacillus dakarensis]
MIGTVHILNGQEMYRFFKKKQFLEEEILIPFNEAMCFGETCNDLFSQEFINMRAKVHQVSIQQYSEITLDPLRPFFKGNFDKINLWFDTDMFCQINLLTLLAWLDFTHYGGAAHLHLVDDHFELVHHFEIEVRGYYSLYKQVLIAKEMPKHIEPAPIKKGVALYLNYLHKDSYLMKFISEHQHVQEKELVNLLLHQFREYGLGDQQYSKIIESYRKGESLY